MAALSTREVLEDHLQQRREGHLEVDIRRNYAEDVVLLCKYGVFKGVDALRESADRLGAQIPDAEFGYDSVYTDGEIGYLEWSASRIR